MKVNKLQFGFMPGKRTVNALFITRKLLEKYLQQNRELCLCFVDLEKAAFDRVPRKVMEWHWVEFWGERKKEEREPKVHMEKWQIVAKS